MAPSQSTNRIWQPTTVPAVSASVAQPRIALGEAQDATTSVIVDATMKPRTLERAGIEQQRAEIGRDAHEPGAVAG